MSRVERIIEIVDGERPGLLGEIAAEDAISKEELVRKVLALSHGPMVRIHQNGESCPSPPGTDGRSPICGASGISCRND